MEIERAHIDENLVIFFKDHKDNLSTSKDKPIIWIKNKNIVHNGVADAKIVQNVWPTLN